jgi:NADH:ubiquinone oxidoreductase subunit H
MIKWNFLFILNLIQFFIITISVLISVAFFTLFERKILGLIQLRKAPSKVGVIGIFQPFADAIKLFSKDKRSPKLRNFLTYFYSPIYILVLRLLFFLNKTAFWGYIFFKEVLALILLFSLGVYRTLIPGWSSNSKYSLIGGYRRIAQSLSYEVVLGLRFFLLRLTLASLSLYTIKNYNLFLSFVPLFVFLFFSLIIEINRRPFDLSECESELVSGFNVEYGGLEFSLIFLGENLIIIFSSYLISLFFKNFQFFIFIRFIFLIVWIRGRYPRIRFDKMIIICWVILLPLCINFIIWITIII